MVCFVEPLTYVTPPKEALLRTAMLLGSAGRAVHVTVLPPSGRLPIHAWSVVVSYETAAIWYEPPVSVSAAHTVLRSGLESGEFSIVQMYVPGVACGTRAPSRWFRSTKKNSGACVPPMLTPAMSLTSFVERVSVDVHHVGAG